MKRHKKSLNLVLCYSNTMLIIKTKTGTQEPKNHLYTFLTLISYSLSEKYPTHTTQKPIMNNLVLNYPKAEVHNLKIASNSRIHKSKLMEWRIKKTWWEKDTVILDPMGVRFSFFCEPRGTETTVLDRYKSRRNRKWKGRKWRELTAERGAGEGVEESASASAIEAGIESGGNQNVGNWKLGRNQNSKRRKIRGDGDKFVEIWILNQPHASLSPLCSCLNCTENMDLFFLVT